MSDAHLCTCGDCAVDYFDDRCKFELRLREYELDERRRALTEPERAELIRLRQEVQSYARANARLHAELNRS